MAIRERSGVDRGLTAVAAAVAVAVAASALALADASPTAQAPTLRPESDGSGSGSGTAAWDYGVVFDAGSTGTRVHVYRWPSRSFKALPPRMSDPVEVVVTSGRSKIPLSNVTDGVKALKPLIQVAKAAMAGEEKRFSQFPVFLKATAGMRIQPFAVRESIVKNARMYLRTTGFLFHDANVRVISGEEEGVFGWLTANYIKDTLLTDEPYAALDLGGASTQITFIPDCDIMANLFNVQLGVSFNEDVYTHSFLYFGNSHQFYRAMELFADAAGGQVDVTVPCLPIGYNESYTSYDGMHTFMLHGSSDYAECRRGLAGLFKYNDTCFTQPHTDLSGRSSCSVAGVYQPPLTGKLMAFSSFTYLWSFFDLPTMPAASSLDDLHAKAIDFCAQSWADMKTKYPHVPDEYLSRYCEQAIYTESLIGDAYGLDTSSKSLYVPTPGTVSWTLGSVLYDANAMPWTFVPTNSTPGPPKNPPKVPDTWKIVGVVLVVAVLALTAALGVTCRRLAAANKGGDRDYVRMGHHPQPSL